ncbi:MAG: hypothetical protein VXV96_12750 [Bdellovibrionota bacterium]|nr:hypothetical protein [Bdellovibrionota bacterium]
MKKFIASLFVLSSLSSFSAVGRTSAVENYLSSEFQNVLNISSPWELPATQQCDEVVSVYVTGNRGSGTTSYDCTVCLVDDGGLMTVDADLSECVRD